MAKYVCGICGYIYDEEKQGSFDQLPDDWKCPLCGAAKSEFVRQPDEPAVKRNTEELPSEAANSSSNGNTQITGSHEWKALSIAQMSALCSNLAKGCEKQYLAEEAGLFRELAEYYRKKAGTIDTEKITDILSNLNADLTTTYVDANAVSKTVGDRGALRVLTWSEKVSRIMSSILKRYETEKDALLSATNIYVCEICGFIFIGDQPPEICPVCKVPNKKLTKIERGE